MGHIYFNAGMKGNKTTLWEGGHRVPCLISLPSGIKPGTSNELTHVQDIMPTLLDLCKIDIPKGLDGVSLKSLTTNAKSSLNDRKLVINYSRMPGMKVNYTNQPTKPQKNGAAVLWKKWRLLENKYLYNVENDPMQEKDVANNNSEILKQMQDHLDLWWNDVKDNVEIPLRVNIGHPSENPAMLTACEWLDVFVDQQKQIRLAEKKNGDLYINVLESGNYKFTLRRWPKESQLRLDQGVKSTKVEDGMFLPGIKLPIVFGRIDVDGEASEYKRSEDGGTSISFEKKLEIGPNILRATFYDNDKKEVCGAYYVYAELLK
jgi:hypothetical protein